MKIIRKSTFETNSSSSHSLVLSKEPVKFTEDDDPWDKSTRVFGSCYDLYSAIGDWNFKEEQEELKEKLKKLKEEDPQFYKYDYYSELQEKYGFDFSRGVPRIYDDFIHKTAFIIAVNKYKDDEDEPETSEFIDKVIEKAEEYNKEIKNERINGLIEVFLKDDFKNNDFIDNAFSYECSNYIHLLYEIMTDEDLIDRFIFNNESYIALGGDEYEGSYLKLVGTTSEYYERYGSSQYYKEFEKRMNEVYPEDKYVVKIEL